MPSDPFAGRQPTSHERATGLPWDASYHDGPAPWDVGEPQRAVVRLAASGAFTGAVLDAGCGTGENALHLASLGLSVLGVDVAPTALAMGRAKAAERGLDVSFVEADALHLGQLERAFDTVLDSALFHTFDANERPAYVTSLAAVTDPGATLYVVCFSDDNPDADSAPVPHPVSEEELRAPFNSTNGWEVVALERDRLQTSFHERGAPAWSATIRRI